ncbi:MAG: uracil-DNA glycosylase [Alphaproteobacteria bacterium]|nr:uracil-DNA glycosylase [Alphaproteobacteria bacterium]
MRPEDALALLRWQIAIGADEALAEEPIDRTAARPPASPVAPIPAAAPAVLRAVVPPAAAGSSAREAAAAAGSVEELRAALAAFEGCALKKTATNLVFGDGDPTADVMLVGEAPGADEDRLGKPFVGVSGQLLDRMLQAIGLDRRTAYITNILPWRPPGNRKPTAAEIALCLPFVRRHIELVAPRLLVCVGGTAASALLDRNEGIMKLRGRVLQYHTDNDNKTIDTICIFHPAFLLRSPGQKREAWRDLLTIRRRLNISD